MGKLIRTVTIAFLIGLAVCLLGYLWTKDAAPPDVSDLRVERPDLPDEQNAWSYFRKAGIEANWPDYREEREEDEKLSAALELEEWDEELVEKWLERNAEALETWRRGLRQNESVAPKMKVGALMPELEGMRTLAQLAVLRAAYLHRQGRDYAAFEECLRTIRFGHRIQNSRGPLLHYFVGNAVKAIGVYTWLRLLPEAELAPDALREFARELQKYQRNEEGLKNTFRTEYEYQEQTVEQISSGRFGAPELGMDRARYREMMSRGFGRLFWKPNATRRLLARMIRVSVDNVPRTLAETDFSEMPETPEVEGPFSIARLTVSGNSIGRILIPMLKPAYERVQEQKCRSRLEIAVLRTMLALKAHKVRTGRLPESLRELVPQYLPRMPADPFDGEPLRYSREKRIVYSVGQDLEDSGGSKGDDRPSMEEPTYEIEI
ncbi:MAG: hypothetical protein ACOC7T_04590 [Planctomycetota bacterium]